MKERQYNPTIQEQYKKNPLKQGKSDETQEIEAEQYNDYELDEEEEEEA